MARLGYLGMRRRAKACQQPGFVQLSYPYSLISNINFLEIFQPHHNVISALRCVVTHLGYLGGRRPRFVPFSYSLLNTKLTLIFRLFSPCTTTPECGDMFPWSFRTFLVLKVTRHSRYVSPSRSRDLSCNRIVDKKYPPLAASHTTSKSFQPKGARGTR